MYKYFFQDTGIGSVCSYQLIHKVKVSESVLKMTNCIRVPKIVIESIEQWYQIFSSKESAQLSTDAST